MRVVVADPSRTVLKAVSLLLANDGHTAITFADGLEALAYIKADPSVCALMTSAELTTMSGSELCWETRLLSGHDRAIYIILMSSNADERHVINALDSGADEFLRKPPAREELYARLRSAQRFVRMKSELIRLAMTDPLTGVLNRRAFFEKAQQAGARATVSNRLTAVMLDVDHFKRVNDTYGHDVGDQVLRSVACEVPAVQTIVGRLGGEEFAILLEGSTLKAGIELAECLRTRIAALTFETQQGQLSLTCSFGVSEWEQGEGIDQLLKRADGALYEAKRGGRNLVVGAGPSVSNPGDPHGSGVVRSSDRNSTGGRNELAGARSSRAVPLS
jgi:two-component system cell cycle response regulator